MAVKSFQRDTLVAVQDRVIQLDVLLRAALRAAGREREDAKAELDAAAGELRMLATRIRDQELRAAVNTRLKDQEQALEREESRRFPTRAEQQQRMVTAQAVYDRAGLLIQTLDAIDED